METLKPNPQNSISNTGRVENDSLYLGEQLENPYSIENMTIAWQNVQQEYPEFATHGLQIIPTHRYIKFAISTRQELSILEEDSSLILFPYPLDYEMLGEGSEYNAPQVSEGQPNFFYASVEVDKNIPTSINYEVLSQLFIPDEFLNDNNTYKISGIDIAEELVDTLVDEALRITDNLEEEEAGGRIEGKWWVPAGNIKTIDEFLPLIESYVPIEGVVVHARRWFTTKEGRTNSVGDFSCNGTFKRKANYSIRWKSKEFKLTSSVISPFTSTLNGPKIKGDWIKVIQVRPSIQYVRAHVFRAAYHYYYQNINNLRRPPGKKPVWGRMQIAVIDKPGDSNGDHGVFLNKYKIRVWNSPNSDYPVFPRYAYKLYGTTIHELAHASHAQMDLWNYNNAETIFSEGKDRSIVPETWARGVQWELSRLIYPEYNHPIIYVPLYTRRTYTGLVQAMIDVQDIRLHHTTPYYSSFYRLYNENRPLRYAENVEGYTIRQIEDALIGVNNLTDWINNIKNDYENPTENGLDALLEHWETAAN